MAGLVAWKGRLQGVDPKCNEGAEQTCEPGMGTTLAYAIARGSPNK